MTRASSASRLVAALTLAVLVSSACAPTPGANVAAADAEGARDLAREAGDLLLLMSAYDYALAGTLSGQRTYVVDPARYAGIGRASAARIQRFTGAALTATLDSAGPVKERVVALADSLVDLARDTGAYADGGDPAVLGKVVTGVARSWEDLRSLHRLLRPVDDDLGRTIARGASMTVQARAEPVYAITVGPYASAADAEAAAKRIGSVDNVARAAPFVVRVGTYPDKRAADTAAAGLSAKGFTGIATQEDRYVFTRGGTLPDAELWREPERVIDVQARARRIAVSPNAAWVAAGGDDGSLAILTGEGVLRSLPRFSAGVSHLAFSDDGRWLMGGGQTLANFILPQGTSVGSQVKMPSLTQQLVYVPKAYYFAAISKGPTGEPPGGPGSVAGRAPDGAPLVAFPITAPSSGGALAATLAGELYIATATQGDTDIEVLDLTRDRQMRGVLRVPGTARALAIDPGGVLGAVVTDKGVYRFGPHDVDPAKTLTRIFDVVTDLGFGRDGTLYILTKTRLSAHDLRGEMLWSTPLIDARRLVLAARPIVLDASDRLMAFGPAGAIDDLGVAGNVVDVAASPDGKRIAVLTDGSRALIFKLP